MINELDVISKLFVDNNINYVFLKGSSMIANKYYKDLGERMIGDIDVLVEKEDYIKSIEIVKKFGYYEVEKNNFFDSIHYPRLVNDKMTFALEIHKDLVKKNKNIINISEFIKSRIKLNNYYLPSHFYLLKNIIYNYYLNHYGELKCSYNYRTIYDSILILREHNLKLSEIKLKSFRSFDNFK